MQNLEPSLLLLQDMGLPPNKFCITGSAALALWSKRAVELGYAPLFNRCANDVDILSINPCFNDVVHNANLRARHGLGLSDCLNIDIGNSAFDLTRQWPYLLIDTSEDIEPVSSELMGFRVMHIHHVAALKQRLDRPKDREDLAFLNRALWPH